MKRMTIPAILVAAVLAFALAGCSGNAKQNMTDETVKGVWTLDSGADTLGFDAYLNFAEDSTFEMLANDSYIDGEYKINGTDGSVATSDDRTVKFFYSNNKLIVGSENGSQLVFRKATAEEEKELLEGSDEDVDVEQVETVDEVINPIDPVTIADDDKVSIVVTAKGTDFTADPAYWMTIKNKTDKAVYYSAEDFTVGGKAIEGGLGDELEPGEEVETSIYFDHNELGGLDALTTTDGVIVVNDSKTDAEVARYPFHME